MQQKFLQQAHADLPVYLTDVYRDFQKTGTRPFHLRLTLYDGTARSFPLQLLPDGGQRVVVDGTERACNAVMCRRAEIVV